MRNELFPRFVLQARFAHGGGSRHDSGKGLGNEQMRRLPSGAARRLYTLSGHSGNRRVVQYRTKATRRRSFQLSRAPWSFVKRRARGASCSAL